jgi:AmmeMemoRadiSam system protein A
MKIELQNELLKIARASVKGCVSSRSASAVAPTQDHPVGFGAFVTLHGPGHSLRGCIGCLSSEQNLAELIAEMAESAALRDPRFSPVQVSEVDSLHIEISVLSPAEPVESLNEVLVGRDGLLVVGAGRRGVLLPQVAQERGWSVETFVEQTCIKANFDRNAFHKGRVELYKFSAEVFSESL